MTIELREYSVTRSVIDLVTEVGLYPRVLPLDTSKVSGYCN